MGEETAYYVTLPCSFSSEGYWAHLSTSSWNPSNRGIVTAIPSGTSQIYIINGNGPISDARWYIIGK